MEANFWLISAILGALIVLSGGHHAYAEDGTYDATVTTSSGTYSVPVDVEDGQVTGVHWPNGGDMGVDGAELDGIAASGTNSRGETIDIEVDDPNYESDDDK